MEKCRLLLHHHGRMLSDLTTYSKRGHDVLWPKPDEGIGAEDAVGSAVNELLCTVRVNDRMLAGVHKPVSPSVCVSTPDQDERHCDQSWLFFALNFDCVICSQQDPSISL